MTKTFEEIVSNYKDPKPEWTVTINGKNYSNSLELLEFTDEVNNSLKFTVKLSGVKSSDDIPEDSEVVVERAGAELFRGVLKQVEPNTGNTYTFKGTGYSGELEGDVKQKFKSDTVQGVVDSLIDGTSTNTNVSRTFSTSYGGGVSSRTVEDFRAEKKQLGEVNRLMGDYDAEWYTTYDGSGNPVFNVTDQISFTDNGNPLDTLTTYGSQSAEMVKQNSNRNKGDFDGVVVRGYGDGEDQVTATAGSTGKGNRVLIYTDKTILSQSQAQSRADNLNSSKKVAWQEIEVKPSDPNRLYSVGDELKIDSEEARLNDVYRVVKAYYKFWPGEAEAEAKLNLSNKPQTFVDDYQKQKDQTDSQTDYMQGARNVWGDKEAANATSVEPLTIDFEVPEDVNDTTGGNRLERIEFNYACTPFQQSADTSSVTADNFDPSVEVVGTDVKSQGVKMERSNIRNHNHPVASATSGGAGERSRFDRILFNNETVPSSGWHRLGGQTIGPITDINNDLAHNIQLDVEGIDGTYNLHFALLRSDDTITAGFRHDPWENEIVAGEVVDFINVTDGAAQAGQHWRFDDPNASKFDKASIDRNPTHVFSQAGSYDVTLEVWSYDPAATGISVGVPVTIATPDKPNQRFVITEASLDASDFDQYDKIIVDDMPGNEGVYTISSAVNSGSDIYLNVYEEINIDSPPIGNGTAVIYPSVLVDDSFTKTIDVLSPSGLRIDDIKAVNEDAESEDDLTSQEYLDALNVSDVEIKDEHREIAASKLDEESKLETSDVSAQDKPYWSHDSPNDGEVFHMTTGDVDVNFDSFASDTGGSTDVDVEFFLQPVNNTDYFQLKKEWFGIDFDNDTFTPNFDMNFDEFNDYPLGDNSYSGGVGDFQGGPEGEYSWSWRTDGDDVYVENVERQFTVARAEAEISANVNPDGDDPSEVGLDLGRAPIGEVDDVMVSIDGGGGTYITDGNTFELEPGDSEAVVYGTDAAELFIELVQTYGGSNFDDAEVNVDGLSDDYSDGEVVFSSNIIDDVDYELEMIHSVNDYEIKRVDGSDFGTDYNGAVFQSFIDGEYKENGLSDGQHTAEVTYYDDSGNVIDSDSTSFTINLNDPPTADFTYSPSNPDAYQTVSFTDESTDPDSSDPDSNQKLVKWTWDFGDGSTQTITSDANTDEDGSTSHSYSSSGSYTVTLTVEDDKGATDTTSKTVNVGATDILDRTIAFSGTDDAGGSPTTLDSSELDTQATDLPNGRTLAQSGVSQIGTQSSPAGDSYWHENIYIPNPSISEEYEVHVATQGGASAVISGEVLLERLNHSHEIARRDDFTGEDPRSGAGAENKEVQYVRAESDRGDVLLDFSANNEPVTLDTTSNGNSVTITVANIDEDGNLSSEEQITANNGTQTTSNSYSDEELYISIDSASDKQSFEVRDQSNDDVYTLAAAPEGRFQSAQTEQETQDVSRGDGSSQDVIEDISDNLLAGSQANNVKIYIDDDPDDNNTNSEQDITGDLYNGASNSGTPKDKGLDLSNYVDSPGWYRLKIEPDQPSFVKSRVFLDHKKESENQ